MKATVAALVAALLMAGCSGSGDDSTTDGPSDDVGGGTGTTSTGTSGTRTSGTSTGTTTTGGTGSGANRAPAAATFLPSTVEGQLPLRVNFTIDGTDPDGDAVTWTLDADGDGNVDRQGTSVPATANHTYGSQGTFNATLTVSDGKLTANKTVAITVTAAADMPQPDYHFEGTITGSWNPAVGYVGDPSVHTFDVIRSKASMTIAITEGDTAPDLDFYVMDPNGAEVAVRDGIFPLVPAEPDVVIDAPALGTWSVRVEAANSVAGEYELDITFA